MLRLKTSSFIPVVFSAFFCFSSVAHAEKKDSVNGNVPNAQLQKELAVLRFQPDSASESCINALKELHKTQDLIDKKEQRSSSDPDLAIAHDVLESDFENAIEMCSPDVRRLCGVHDPDVKLAKACENVGSLPDTTPEN